MANREENIKKINAELEKLTDEELDAVAGGMNWDRREYGWETYVYRREQEREEKLEAEVEKWEFSKRFMAVFRFKKASLELKERLEKLTDEELECD